MELEKVGTKFPGFLYRRQPRNVYWETTISCDLACQHCRASAIPHRDPRELTTEQGKALMRSVQELGSMLVLTGGDPLKRPDIAELIEYGRSLPIHVSITPSTTPLLHRADGRPVSRTRRQRDGRQPRRAYGRGSRRVPERPRDVRLFHARAPMGTAVRHLGAGQHDDHGSDTAPRSGHVRAVEEHRRTTRPPLEPIPACPRGPRKRAPHSERRRRGDDSSSGCTRFRKMRRSA